MSAVARSASWIHTVNNLVLLGKEQVISTKYFDTEFLKVFI